LELELKRREFLKWSLANAVLVSGASQAGAQTETQTRRPSTHAQAKPPEYKTGASIMQGATDATKTQFSIVFDANRDLDIFVTDASGKRYQADAIRAILFLTHSKKITKAFFSGLVPNEDFSLNLVDLKTGEILDERSFQTLDLTKPSLKFALCSCMDEALHEAAIWRDIVDKKPDMLFFIGDAVYADTGAGVGGANPYHLWKRFFEAPTTLYIYYSKKLIPIVATWDDHDFGLDDSNCRNYQYVRDSQINFLNFFAQEESHCSLLQAGPGVSSALKYGDQLFLFLDGRSYREATGSKERYAHWGQDQETWMMDLISKNTGPTWFMTGTQIFPAFLWKESVSKDHPVQFAAVIEQLRNCSSKVIFGSGDVHFSEISEIEAKALGYVTYELTSSSIHSGGTFGAPGTIPNKRRIMGTGQRNYILVDSTPKGSGCSAIATCYGVNGQIHFSKSINL
jgi:alkaline phosphatase D